MPLVCFAEDMHTALKMELESDLYIRAGVGLEGRIARPEMEATMEETGELENSGCSSTSTNEGDYGACTWSDWAPVVDWRPFSADTPGDFQGLIESMMCDDNSMDTEEGRSAVYEPTTTSTTTTTSAGSPTSCEGLRLVGIKGDDDKGLRLVHLLMAAAEALSGSHSSRELARVILVRLREIVPPAASGGTNMTNMERLAPHFADALQGLLDASTGGEGAHGTRNGSAAAARDEQQPSDALTAFQLLLDMSPYVKFGHFTSNQAILEAVGGDRRVHIVDYDIMEGVHWASLMQALVSREDGPPPPHLRITAVTRAGGSGGGGARKSASMVQETGRRLVAFAASIGQPFSFGQCRLDQDEKFRPSTVKVVKGEAVVGNCVIHPPQRSAASVASFLAGMGSLGAKLVTLVEEEEIRKGEEGSGFVTRFMDELHRYSAVWDSLEAGFPMQGRARGLVEKVILGPRIAGAVRRAYRRRDEEEGNGGWGDWMAKAGFDRTGISFFNHCQARLLLGLFHDGYRVEEDEPNKLVLCWKSRRLVSASVWSAPPPPPPPSPPPTSMTAVAHGFTTNKHDAELLCS